MEILADEMARVKGAADLNAFCEAYGLERRGRDNYVCPICHSGNGPNHTAAFKVQGNRWHCFGCDRGGDVFDLAGVLNHTDDKREQLRIVAEGAGLPTSRGHKSANNALKAEKRPTNRKTAEKPADAPTEADARKYDAGRAKHRAYINESQGRIDAPEAVAYLEARGITLEAAKRFGLGYDPTARRIIIPWPAQDGETPYYHTDRAIDEGRQPKYTKPKAEEVGPQPLWGAQATREAAYFIVEGPLDALAVFEAGYWAIATCGASSRDVIEAAASGDGTPVVMLDFDADEAKGPRHQADMCAALEAAGHDYLSATPDALQGCKDAAELLEKDPAALKASLNALHAEAVAGRERREAEQYAAALESLRVFDPIDVTRSLYALENAHEPIPTGLTSVDAALGGGLPSRGLVALGAVSSVGKTTFAVQLADTLAAEGRGVLFVTIEQSAEEIVAKSISRFMAAQTRQHGQRIKASAQSLTSKKARDRWAREDPEKLEALKNACRAYDSTTRRADGTRTLRIMEATRQPTVADVRAAAEWIAKHDGQAPVIFIDYLQLLAAPKGHDRDSDKAIVDSNVTALRKAARDLDTCVFVISSLNRSSYSGSVSLESFKESGAIEYGADVLLGLQPADLARDLEDETNEAKARKKAKRAMNDFKASARRECELVVLKNRNNGLPRDGVRLAYETVCNTFEETPAAARRV